MQFVSVRDLKLRPGQVWDALEQSGEVVITSNGRPIGVLTGVTAETLEETLAAIRQACAQTALSALRREAARSGTAELPDAAIAQEVAAVRKHRRRA